MRLLALSTAILGAAALAVAGRADARLPGGSDAANVNLEVILRAPEGADGFGHVKFRQPKDDEVVILLGVWVRDLAPDTKYRLQRAVDTVVDGECTGTAWATLGRGNMPQAIATDDRGTGVEELSRDVSAIPVGTEFDIHFRVIDDRTAAVVLESGCYQYVVSR
jgi:hypothetical protein